MLRFRALRPILAMCLAMAGVGALVQSAFAWELLYYSDGTHRGPIYYDHTDITWNFVPMANENNYNCPGWEQTDVKQAATNWTTAGLPITMTQSTDSSPYYFDVEVECYTNPPDGAGYYSGTTNPVGGDEQCQTFHWSDANGGYWVCTLSRVRLYMGSRAGSSQGDTQYDVYVAMHELGHSLGLDHSCVTDSIMSGPNAAAGCPKQAGDPNFPNSPRPDDKAGVNWIYGPHDSGGCASSTLIEKLLSGPPAGC